MGFTGGALTCAELASAIENSGIAVTRLQGSPHAQSFNPITLPNMVTIVECASLSEGMGAAYIAREADVTILCVNEWIDSRKVLVSVVEELQFAQVRPAGIVFLTQHYLK